MKLGRNLETGHDWSLSSWKSLDDPARGEYTFGIDPRGYPQVMLKKGSEIQFRAGSWNGLRFTGARRLDQNPVFKFEFVLNEKEVYFDSQLINKSVVTRMVMEASGTVERFTWIDQTHSWANYFSTGQDLCNNYAQCGANAKCNSNNYVVCACLDGFEPKSPRAWSFRDYSQGCVRSSPLGCEAGEGFIKQTGMKLPDTSKSWYNMNMSFKECMDLCLKNCSCVASANADIRGEGSGCILWFGGLIDMREFSDSGQDLYVRMAASYIEKMKDILEIDGNKSMKEDLELPTMELSTIAKATNNFSIDNKLGEGGFGPVYKGTLPDGQEIAVKRLSLSSGQGLEEFINEVLLIAKLQHRNLVRLIGCCIQGGERMLIYEYMPNKSLDYFIFDQSRKKILDWQTRINIIDGIARGLLYLHQDSRLRIIHRDLKASNVLLDSVMIPKISDFGMARIVGGDQTEANTNRVVGTYGYMAPEYAVDGLFSLKSDIFSFGVLILEIVSGRRNRGFYSQNHHHNLVGQAWRLWMSDRPLELIDDIVGESTTFAEFIRCIHVGLLCVQHRPEDRPNISTVVLMLSGESSLPQPKQPGFFTERNLSEEGSSSSFYKSNSTNEITVTALDPR
uniref:non-specific serine/threonine protein kinase n=1 Tax=Rhizophora mucronata TaxID=61149 RepID=A0A2P2MSF5_RHIMU